MNGNPFQNVFGDRLFQKKKNNFLSHKPLTNIAPMITPPSLGNQDQIDGGNKINNLKQQLLEAQQEISRLKEENITLKKQYEEALKLTNQMDEIHQENAVLTRSITKLKSENDDLNKRLKICLQMNEDNKNKQQNSIPDNRANLNELRESLEKSNKIHQEQVAELNNVVQETTQMLESVKNQNSDLRSIIKGIVEAGESYFGETFSSPESLRQFFLIPKPKIEVSDEKKSEVPQPIDSSVLDGLKAKIKNERKLRKELASKLSETEKEHENQAQQFQKIINDLENKVSELQKISKDNELKRKHEIAETLSKTTIYEDSINRLKIKIQDLKEQNQKLEELQNRPNPLAPELNDLKDQVSSQNQKIQENLASISTLKNQISSLIAQLKASEMRIESTKKKLGDSKDANEKLNKEQVKLRTELSKLELTNEELKEKLKATSAQLKADRSTIQQNCSAFDQLESNYSKSKSSVQLLQNALDKTKDDISNLYKERENLISTIQKLNSLLISYENYIHQQKKLLKKRKAEECKKVEPQIIETFVEPEIPITSWFSTEFSRDLTNMIQEVAKNEALPINAKLRHVLSVIGKYYNSQIDDAEKIIKGKEEIFNELSDKFNNFLNGIGNQIDIDLLSISDPIKPTIEWIINLKDQKTEADVQRESVSNELKDLLDNLQLSTPADIEKKMAKLQMDLNTALNELRKERKRSKKQKQTQKELGDSFEEHQREIEEVFNKQKKKIELLEKKVDDYEIEIRQLKTKNTDLSNEIIRLKSDNEEQVGEVTAEKNAFLKQMRDEYEKEKVELLSVIEEKTIRIEGYCKQLVKLEKEASQWKRTAEALKKQKKEKDKELAEIKSQFEEEDNDWKEKIQNEKIIMSQQFNNIIAELKSKNKEYRALLNKTSEALNDSDEKIKILTARLAEAENTNQQNLLKLASQKDEIEREKQLIDTKIKASQLSNEMKCQSMLEKERSNQEMEKRKLFGFVAKSFHQFFDGRKQLNDECFKILIKNASDEIERLMSEDAATRRLLGISPSESIQDSVAKLLLTLYKPQ